MQTNTTYLNFPSQKTARPLPAVISCDWQALRAQLLSQWNNLTARELDRTQHDRRQIALLIERKYGIHFRLVENYLRNFERTMPLAA